MKICYCEHCNSLREILTNVNELLSMHNDKPITKQSRSNQE